MDTQGNAAHTQENQMPYAKIYIHKTHSKREINRYDGTL